MKGKNEAYPANELIKRLDLIFIALVDDKKVEENSSLDHEALESRLVVIESYERMGVQILQASLENLQNVVEIVRDEMRKILSYYL